MEDKVLGTSTEALLNNNDSIHANRESSMELLSKLATNLSIGKDTAPMVIGIVDGKPVVLECTINENGIIQLPQTQIAPTLRQIKQKQKVVKRVLDKIKPTLVAEIESVTFIALMRKDETKIKKILEELNKGAKPKLENRVGCIWVIIGEYEFVI